MITQTNKIKTMTIAALLSAIAIIIPMYMPRIQIEPASFTLCSHVPLFIAMFISPIVAVFVAIITTIGFLFGGFPPIIVLRALTHVIFALVGAYILKKNNKILLSLKTAIPFVLLIAVIHSIFEVIVSTVFYFTTQSSADFMVVILGLVGVGTIVHSTIDFTIAAIIWIPLQKVVGIPFNARIKLRPAVKE